MVTAWGETKTVYQWGKDPRARATYFVIRARLCFKTPWPPEKAISTPPSDTAARRSVGERKKIEAFGERKGISEWLGDSRCHVGFITLHRRLKRGVPLEVALGKELPVEYHAKNKLIEAFGEAKTLSEWVRDSRCRVAHEWLRKALIAGVHPEVAILGEVGYGRRYRAFGEEKTVAEWAVDPRCKVSRTTIDSRLAAGIPFSERLLTDPRMRMPVRRYMAFGESKAILKWLKDERCQVSRTTLVARLAKGMDFEEALTTPTPPTQGLLSAFGEQKTFDDWCRDERCAVSRTRLLARLESGVPLEQALTTAANQRK